MSVRPAAVAGRFYPSDRDELERAVRVYLEATDVPSGPVTRALVAPHAGYRYSGPVAGYAYAHLEGDGAAIRRVVLIGPSHHASFDGIALPEAEAFSTPLGDHDVDREAADALASVPGVVRADGPHRHEHCLEVQLPFLRVVLGAVPIVPLVTGAVAPSTVADALERLWTGDTLLVVSSDLSHYLGYEEASRVDAETADAVERLDDVALDAQRACGATALRGLLVAARRRGLAVRCVDLRNSGDTEGPADRVVGYGAFVVRGKVG